MCERIQQSLEEPTCNVGQLNNFQRWVFVRVLVIGWTNTLGGK